MLFWESFRERKPPTDLTIVSEHSTMFWGIGGLHLSLEWFNPSFETFSWSDSLVSCAYSRSIVHVVRSLCLWIPCLCMPCLGHALPLHVVLGHAMASRALPCAMPMCHAHVPWPMCLACVPWCLACVPWCLVAPMSSAHGACQPMVPAPMSSAHGASAAPMSSAPGASAHGACLRAAPMSSAHGACLRAAPIVRAASSAHEQRPWCLPASCAHCASCEQRP